MSQGVRRRTEEVLAGRCDSYTDAFLWGANATVVVVIALMFAIDALNALIRGGGL